MQWRSVLCAAALMLGTGSMYAADPSGSANFTVSETTRVPGLTMKPGGYSIRVVDHLSDRLIIRVDDVAGKSHATFIGITNETIQKPSSPGPVPWNSKANGAVALRGFAFDEGPVVEFVYPKAEAVSLAKVNQAKVPAIDPASEGRGVADKSLSKDDMEVVTLWMLSSTTVGTDAKPAIQAEKYKAVQVASNEPPPPPPAPAYTPAPASAPAAQAAAPTQTAAAAPAPRPARKHVISTLPHTGSNLPMVWLLGSLSFFAALGLSLRRFAMPSPR